MRRKNKRARPIQIDVTIPESLAAVPQQVESLLGGEGLCGLVNNAGICVVGPSECVTLSEWRRQFEVNLFGPIALTQSLLPLLRRYVAANGPGSARIVNMSSITGRIATPLFGAYSGSKSALESFSDALRLELKGHGIHVCVMIPGTIQSEIWRKEKAAVDAIAPGSTARRLYSTLIDNVARYVFRAAEKAKPAALVARAVEDCLTKRNPRTRTLIAWEAHVGARAKNFLPETWLDFLISTTLGIPKQPHSDQAESACAVQPLSTEGESFETNLNA